MIINEPSRMYAALRCIESELEKEKPSIAAIRAIILEAGRELRPTPHALDVALWWRCQCGWANDESIKLCNACGTQRK